MFLLNGPKKLDVDYGSKQDVGSLEENVDYEMLDHYDAFYVTILSGVC